MRVPSYLHVVPKLNFLQLIILGHMVLGKKCGLDKNQLCIKQEFACGAVLHSDHKASTQLIHVRTCTSSGHTVLDPKSAKTLINRFLMSNL